MRISTITATTKLEGPLDLDVLRNNTYQDDDLTIKNVGFGNQVTIKSSQDKVSIKIFKNGSIQMTGIKSVEAVQNKVRDVTKFIASIYGREIQAYDTKIVMINSDISLGIQLRREHLCSFLRIKYPKLIFSFEPCIYQGVIIKYMHNEDADCATNGVCTCPEGVKCNGKGRGDGAGRCRKISIIVFHSGSVIITGAVSMQQLHIAKGFLLGVIDEWKAFNLTS